MAYLQRRLHPDERGKRLRLVMFWFCCIIRISQVACFGLLDGRQIKFAPRQEEGRAKFRLFKTDRPSDDKLPLSLSELQATPSTASQPPRPHCVQFASPLLEYGYPPTVQELRNSTLSEKPILLYLPGFDGTYICPFIQFPELGTEFEVWCMSVGMEDRSTFEELKWSVLDFTENLSQVLEDTSFTKPNATTALLEVDSSSVAATQNTSTTSKSEGKPFWSSWFSSGSDPGNPKRPSRRPIYLVGESFGGLLASEVALTLLNQEESASSTNVGLQGLVLINPATCYDRSQLAAKGPSVAKLPSLLYPFGLAGLLPLFTDEYSFAQLRLILSAKALPSVIDDPLRESFMGRVAFSLPAKLEYMNQGTLQWRLKEWLEIGCERMESRMKDFQDHPSFRTLILVGEKDLTLPSIAEAERLVNLLPKSQVHVVEGAGHASTCGSRMDMTAQIRKAFPELRKKTSSSKPTKSSGTDSGTTAKRRTAMKPEAADGVGPYFGMEPRYDGASIGLSPILYWCKENFQALRKVEEVRKVVTSDDTSTTTAYTQIFYQLREDDP